MKKSIQFDGIILDQKISSTPTDRFEREKKREREKYRLMTNTSRCEHELQRVEAELNEVPCH